MSARSAVSRQREVAAEFSITHALSDLFLLHVVALRMKCCFVIGGKERAIGRSRHISNEVKRRASGG
jgi:hypothetical protein